MICDIKIFEDVLSPNTLVQKDKIWYFESTINMTMKIILLP